MLRKVALSTVLLGFSLYILLPTPDELIIYPTVGFFLSFTMHMPFLYGVLLTMVIYRVVGVASLLGSLFIGGKPIYCLLKEKYRKRKILPLLTRLGSTSA